MTLTAHQAQYLSTAGLIYRTALDSPDGSDAVRAEAFECIEAIVRQARIGGFDDTVIAEAMRLPIFLIVGVI